jgi:hypothetical protein
LIWHDSDVRTRFAAIVALLTVFGAACGGGGGHSAKSSDRAPTASGSSVTATGTPSPTGPLTTGPGVLPGEKPPVMSADAKQHTPTGALAFAAYYFKALDWSTATTDTFLLRSLAAPHCPACNRAINELDALRDEGGHVSGGRINLVSTRLVTGNFETKSDLVVKVVANEASIVLVHPSSPPSTSAPAITNDVSLVFLSWRGGRWQVFDVGAQS